MRKFQCLLLLLLFISCASKNEKVDIEQYKNQFSTDSFKNKGKYVWSFQLMGTKQTSIHKFFRDSILYEMKGKIHSTKYPMYKLSYNKKENKWIGIDNNNTVYVLFFKEKTDNTLTIYKRKCEKNGIEEALNFQFPKPDATDDHGWNVYALDGYETKDVLPILGDFSNEKNKISITDKIISIDDVSAEKMSFHSGERRWVGKHKNKYVQVFFKSLANNDALELSVNWFEDLEELYRTKYESINDWTTFKKAK